MPKIDIAEAKEGMKLAKPVCNLNGQMLIPQGAELVEKHLWLLKTWGVSQLEVEAEGDEVQGDPLSRLTSEEREALTAQMAERFNHRQDGNAWLKEVFQICLERAAAGGKHV